MRRIAVAFALCPLLLAGSAPVASAEEQPSIVKAYGLDWIERVREEAWPQPKDRRPIICLLDSGVAITPDTPADNPEGPIVARLALDGGTGLPQGETFEHLHGTAMASVIAAPRNGVGTVGVFPQAKIVSVRVTTGDDIFISPAAMRQGVRGCARWAFANGGVSVGAVVMAESNFDQRTSDIESWETAQAVAADVGGIFVAAAGNQADAEVVAPLAVEKILTVGAGDGQGNPCPFSFPRTAEIRGPGCGEEPRPGVVGWPAGSSAATAATGALAAALATRTPEERPESRLVALREGTSLAVDGMRRIAADLFRARFEGLIALPVVESGLSTTVPLGGPAPSAGHSKPATRTVLWRPKIRATWARGRLLIKRYDRRPGLLKVQIAGVEHSVAGSRGVIRGLNRRPSLVTAWVESRSPGAWRSLSSRSKVLK